MENSKELNDKSAEINDLKNFIAQMEIERDKLFKEL
jgi:hypothetical protein